jgi:hypothetical protein
MKDNLFGDLIFSYTRKQAIEDGVLVDLTSRFPKDTRLFKYPIACTSAIWNIVTEACEKTGEDLGAYVWDMCWMAINFRVEKLGHSTVLFKCSIPLGVKEYILKMMVHGGDNGEPVITIMLPDED